MTKENGPTRFRLAGWSDPKFMALSAHQTGANVRPSMNKPRDSRFTPGAGISPPVLAGREKEKNRIAAALDSLEAGLKTAENIALIGPRGNGKTVLLRWAQAQVRERYSKIECVVLNQKKLRIISGSCRRARGFKSKFGSRRRRVLGRHEFARIGNKLFAPGGRQEIAGTCLGKEVFRERLGNSD